MSRGPGWAESREPVVAASGHWASMSWYRLPPRAMFSTRTPRQMPSTGLLLPRPASQGQLGRVARARWTGSVCGWPRESGRVDVRRRAAAARPADRRRRSRVLSSSADEGGSSRPGPRFPDVGRFWARREAWSASAGACENVVMPMVGVRLSDTGEPFRIDGGRGSVGEMASVGCMVGVRVGAVAGAAVGSGVNSAWPGLDGGVTVPVAFPQPARRAQDPSMTSPAQAQRAQRLAVQGHQTVCRRCHRARCAPRHHER